MASKLSLHVVWQTIHFASSVAHSHFDSTEKKKLLFARIIRFRSETVHKCWKLIISTPSCKYLEENFIGITGYHVKSTKRSIEVKLKESKESKTIRTYWPLARRLELQEFGYCNRISLFVSHTTFWQRFTLCTIEVTSWNYVMMLNSVLSGLFFLSWGAGGGYSRP